MKKILFIILLVSNYSFGQNYFAAKNVFGDTVYFHIVPYHPGAGIVHLGIDTVVGSPTFGKLVRKTAGGGTPTLQQVLTAGSTLTANNEIDLEGYYLNFLVDDDVVNGNSNLLLVYKDPLYGNSLQSAMVNNDSVSSIQSDRFGVILNAQRTGVSSRVEVTPTWVDLSHGSDELYVSGGEIGILTTALNINLSGSECAGCVLTDVAGDGYATWQRRSSILNKAYANVDNSGTGETDLDTYTIGANTLTTNGDIVSFNYTVNLSDITATATIKTYFAGTATANTGALTVSATGAVIVTGWLIRTNTTTARVSVSISSPTASTAVYTSETDLTGLDFTATNIIKITGQAGGAGGGSADITFKLGTVKFER